MITFALLLGARISPAEEPRPIFQSSPDGKFRAQIISVAHDNVERNYDIVKIYRGRSEITEYPLLQSNRGTARYVMDSNWSANSRFFVFLTKHVAGHSDWHSPTSIYDTKTGLFWELDTYLGPVVDEKVRLSAPDILEIKVLNPNGGIENSPVIKKLSIAKLLDGMQPKN